MDCALGLIFLMYVLQVDIDPGSALRCYTCAADQGQYYACEHKPTPSQVPSPTCESDKDVCLTLRVDDHNVLRECANHDYCGLKYNSSEHMSCVVCNYDRCNSGFVTPSWTFLLIFASMYSVVKNLQ